MIHIDLEHKKPTDTDLPADVRWSEDDWNAWLERSDQLVNEMASLDASGDYAGRNALIDANRDHWGKLKTWLLALSSGRCWFSETRDLYSHYDVEHFRPKKETKILDGSKRDGYWWLAFDYMNFRICGNVGNRKKGGWFPLKQGSRCSTWGNRCEESEVRYLLDPIDPADNDLITYDGEGNALPVPHASDWERKRVETTMKRLKLNAHVPLAEARRKKWQEVNELIERYLVAYDRSKDGDNPVARERKLAARTALRTLTQPDQELFSVARECLFFRKQEKLNRVVA